jgi:hypothetical protein
VTWPLPQPGLVIRYSYLWLAEHRSGREEGVKDRPCVIVLCVHDDLGTPTVVTVPVTHSRPDASAEAIELPKLTKHRLGLDGEQSWIILSEANRFVWPGPDLRPLKDQGADSVALGFLPPSLFRQVRDKFLALAKSGRAPLVGRT